jgi:flagella basal body P-ring formation protein FlgA
VARAVSSGGIGDVIRVTTPGSREIRQARITAPATVEMVR